MKQPVASFQKLTLTLDQLRTHARLMPGRTAETAKNLKGYEQQQETTHAMLVTELSALGATMEDMSGRTNKETEKNNQLVQSYGEVIRMDGQGLASNLDEIQDELDALGANLRQNLSSQSKEMQCFDEIDVQSDQKRIENIGVYCGALEEASHSIGHSSDSLKTGQRSLAMELDTEQALNQRAEECLAQDHNQLAAQYMSEGRPQAAVEELKQAVEKAPNTADLWFNLARVLVEANDLEEAAKAYDRAVKLDPSSPLVNRVGGWVALQQENYVGATVYFQQALQSSCPLLDRLELLEGLAEAEYRAGRPDLAQSAWERVLEIDPYHPTARLSMEWIR